MKADASPSPKTFPLCGPLWYRCLNLFLCYVLLADKEVDSFPKQLVHFMRPVHDAGGLIYTSIASFTN